MTGIKEKAEYKKQIASNIKQSICYLLAGDDTKLNQQILLLQSVLSAETINNYNIIIEDKI